MTGRPGMRALQRACGCCNWRLRRTRRAKSLAPPCSQSQVPPPRAALSSFLQSSGKVPASCNGMGWQQLPVISLILGLLTSRAKNGQLEAQALHGHHLLLLSALQSGTTEEAPHCVRRKLHGWRSMPNKAGSSCIWLLQGWPWTAGRQGWTNIVPCLSSPLAGTWGYLWASDTADPHLADS